MRCATQAGSNKGLLYRQVDDVLKEPLSQPWIPTDEEASMMRDMVAKEKSWQKNKASKEQWLFGQSGDSGTPEK